jgi:hypothetical protein
MSKAVLFTFNCKIMRPYALKFHLPYIKANLGKITPVALKFLIFDMQNCGEPIYNHVASIVR